ncbi:hypothetical protein, conserved [Babesia ovata]|uniref:Uncharacterized protein n=1 Tax=Babesia ovata TaxID=189622 RepID=A0A2H6KF24_9APIC|nr:uncharacterized protein BOVATA_030930 [Babesia ovata]GBE61600.1 hypothetical protein, conserved [Babesia ovata]
MRDAGLEQASVRRYNVDFCQAYANPDSVVHDGSASLKLYVVARRNSTPTLQSYMPYDVFTHVNDWVDLQETCSVAAEDIFDNGISSSDEEGGMYIGEASPSLIASPAPFTSPGRPSAGASVLHQRHFDSEASSVRSATRSAIRSASRSAIRSPSEPSVRQQAYEGVVSAADMPQDEGIADEVVQDNVDTSYHGVSPPAVHSRSPAPRSVSFAKSVITASPRPRGKRTISGRNNLSPPSPTGYSPFASFGAVYSSGLQGQVGHDISTAATETLAAIRNINAIIPRTTSSNVNPAPTTRRKTKKGTRSKRAPVEDVPETISITSEREYGMGLRIVDAAALDTYPVGDGFDMQPYMNGHTTDFLGGDVGDADPTVASEVSGPTDSQPAVVADEPTRNRKRSRKRVSTAVLSLPATTVEEPPTAAAPQQQPEQAPTIADTAAAAPRRRHDQGVQTLALETMRTSLGVGNDDFDMDEYSSLADRVTAGRLGPDTTKKPTRPRERRPRKAVNSAMLLNSWYISYVDDHKKPTKKRYEHVEPYVDRNRRYPSRARLPPMQHWNSNMTPDGSSVLFLIGVTSDDKKLNLQAQHASGDVVLFNEDVVALESSPVAARVHPDNLPEASLVMTDSSGMMEMQVIESSPMGRLALPSMANNTYTATSNELALIEHSVPSTQPAAGKKRSRRTPRVPTSDSDIGPNATSESRTAPAKGKAKRNSAKPKSGGRKRTREMTVSEALEILKSDSAGSSLGLEESPKSRRQSEFYQELVFNPSKRANVDVLPSDSIAMQNGRHISYRSFFRVDEVETQMYHGSLFQPLVMNSRCRSSNVIIPIGCHVSMGNVNGNFICGYLYCGEDVAIRGLGISWPLKAKQTFFLPIYEEWGIYNESGSMDANIALTFVSI